MSGVSSSWGFKKETTQNTRVVVDRFNEHVSESVSSEVKRIESAGMRGGRRISPGWAVGNETVSGNVDVELVPENAGALLEMCFGTVVSTSGAGPYVHTFSPAALQSYTQQFGRPDSGGTVRCFEYTGMMVDSWSLSFDTSGDGSMIELSMNFLGYTEDLGQTLVTTAYPTLTARWSSVQASLTVGGTEVCVTSCTLNGSNNLRSVTQSCNAGKATISESGFRTYGGEFSADFTDLTQYNLYKAGTENALVITIDDGTADLVITTNARYDGSTPTSEGPEVLEEATSFMCTSETSDAAAITAVLTNADATP